MALDPSDITFCEPTDSGPFPYVLTVSELRTIARAGQAIGIAATESASVVVTLDNCARRVATIIRRPLRVFAQIIDDTNELFFEGFVSLITYARVLSIEISA